jgi:hypothetical protein
MDHIHDRIDGWFFHPNLYSKMVQNCNPNGTLVEIGVWKGKSLSYLCVEAFNHSPGINVVGVDTWAGSLEHQNDPSIKNNTLFDEFSQNIRPVSQNLSVMKMPSLQAVGQFPDKSLDGVFIDGSHEYNDVKDDILAWAPKVREGGILAGHDYIFFWPGVVRAVNELFPSIFNPDSTRAEVGEFCWAVTL